MAQITADHQFVTENQLRTIREFSQNLESNKINKFILEAQQIEIKNFLGASFYSALQADWDEVAEDFTTQKYTDLYFGTTYQDSKGNDVIFNGLAVAHLYFALARITLNNTTNLTRFGNEVLDPEVSTPATPPQVRGRARELEAIGGKYLNECLLYLERLKSDYPLFSYTQQSQVPKTSLSFFRV